MAGDGSTPIETAETLAKIIELRKRGWSFRRIAAAVGGRTKGSIRDEVRRYLANLAEQTAGMAGELRVLESERLDQYLLVIWEQIEQGHLGAIDRALKISARRAALWGLDAPTKIAPTTPDGGKPYKPPALDFSKLSGPELVALRDMRDKAMVEDGKNASDDSGGTPRS